MQRSPLKVVICGRWKHCSKVIHKPGVCYCAVLSVVREMSEAKVHFSMEQHIIIKFLMKEGCKPSYTCSRMKRQYGEKTLSSVSIHKWSSALKKGMEMVENEPRERQPKTSITGENSDRIDALIQENRRITVRELSGILNISHGSVKIIIKQHLQYSKVCTRWIPLLLIDEHKSTRLQVVQSLLSRYEQEGGIFLDSVVTTDEMWVHYFTSESKRSSIQWCHLVSPKPKKAKTTFSVGKFMATIFWDSKGVLYVDFLTECHTINTEYYLALLKGPVKTPIRHKRKRAQTSVSFLQDNACPHVAAHTMDTIQKLKWNILPHPPYIPDLGPSDYHLFGPLKEHLGGKRFRHNEEVIQDVQEWLHWQPKDFFLSGICKLPGHWRKCIANQGDYVEK